MTAHSLGNLDFQFHSQLFQSGRWTRSEHFMIRATSHTPFDECNAKTTSHIHDQPLPVYSLPMLIVERPLFLQVHSRSMN